jgi:hypothetical protein
MSESLVIPFGGAGLGVMVMMGEQGEDQAKLFYEFCLVEPQPGVRHTHRSIVRKEPNDRSPNRPRPSLGPVTARAATTDRRQRQQNPCDLDFFNKIRR